MDTPASIFDSDETLRQLYHDAKRLPEFASNSLFLQWLSVYHFTEKEWVVDRELPTREHHDNTRLDIVIRTLLKDPVHSEVKRRFLKNTWVYWVTGEGKRGKASPENTRYAEEQAYSKTWNYLFENKEAVNSCWVITYYGTEARLWACQNRGGHGFLQPFWPLNGEIGARASYADIWAYEQYWNVAWAYVKQNLQPDPEKFEGFWNPSMSSNSLTFPDPGPSQMAVDQSQVVNDGDYALVKVVKIFQDGDGNYRTQIRRLDKSEQHFPWDFWREGEIRLNPNMPVQGFIADKARCWAWNLEVSVSSDSSDSSDSESSEDPDKDKGKTKARTKAKGRDKRSRPKGRGKEKTKKMPKEMAGRN
ncbi:hypothetical protein MAJ_11133, partial [Metarhizium majus ARSEF 297]